jgi:hypothetical protein
LKRTFVWDLGAFWGGSVGAEDIGLAEYAGPSSPSQTFDESEILEISELERYHHTVDPANLRRLDT